MFQTTTNQFNMRKASTHESSLDSSISTWKRIYLGLGQQVGSMYCWKCSKSPWPSSSETWPGQITQVLENSWTISQSDRRIDPKENRLDQSQAIPNRYYNDHLTSYPLTHRYHTTNQLIVNLCIKILIMIIHKVWTNVKD